MSQEKEKKINLKTYFFFTVTLRLYIYEKLNNLKYNYFVNVKGSIDIHE